MAQNTAPAPVGIAAPDARSSGAPATILLPPMVAEALRPALSADDAQLFCRKLARSHYENFSVVSSLLPRRLRQDFCNVYAFCRTADDLSDEIHDAQASLSQLDRLADLTRQCYAGRAESNLFVALRGTIERYDIPIEPFLDLIDAFQQDQRLTRYQTFDELLDYCRRSANPVGRIVLYMCGYRDEQRQHLSDLTCSALQLANFWQDVRRDLTELDRIYIPAESLRRFELSEEQLRNTIEEAPANCGLADSRFCELIKAEVERTADMFDRGEALLPLLEPSVRGHIALFGKGGRAILQAIREQGYDTLGSRPELSRWQKSQLLLSAVGAKLGSFNA